MHGSEFGSTTLYALMKFSIKKAKEFKPEAKEMTWCVKGACHQALAPEFDP